MKFIYLAEWPKEKERISVTSDGSLDVLSILNYNANDDADKVRENTIASLFFLEEDLHPGSILNLQFVKTTTNYLLHRKISDSIPFSSKKIEEIYRKFSVNDPNSKEAETIKKIIGQCKKSESKGEEKYCAISLESMIEHIISILGNSILVIFTEPEEETDQVLQQQQKVDYAISEVKKVTGNNNNNGTVVVCHKLNYAYVAVFYCHRIEHIEEFKVSLVGADGTKTKAATVCHKDTSEWNPKQLAFQVLDVKPGTVPICHFLTEDNIIWVPNN